MDTNILDIKKNFYNSEYWRSGEGKALWQLRKMQVFIHEISSTETPAPFFSIMSEFADISDDENVFGWFAEWTDNKDQSLLNIEYVEDCFCIYAFDGETMNTEFSYYFSDKNLFGKKDDSKDDDINPWSDLDKAITDSKVWLKQHSENLVDRGSDIKKIFGLL